MITRTSKRIKEHQTHAQPYGCGKIGRKTKGIELERKKEKCIHAKNIIIPILINSTHFHRGDGALIFVPQDWLWRLGASHSKSCF